MHNKCMGLCGNSSVFFLTTTRKMALPYEIEMSETAHLLEDQDVHMINRRLRSRQVCVKVFVMLTYIAVLLWRFIGLILFSIHASDCFFREKVASYRCKNFTLFSHAKEMQIAWQMASVMNTLFVILVLMKVPGYKGYMSALRNNSKHARFWSLFGQLIAAVVYNIILITTESLGISIAIEVGYILVEFFTTLVVYLWNAVPAPWKEPRVQAQHLLYMSTLFVFIFENFYLFLLVSTHVAFDITGVDNIHQTPSELQAISLVLKAALATFYYAIMKFFWNKLFDDRTNLLSSDSV